ncbi:MAG: hypothetical protein JNK45_14115, partial [Myxococcales bacterium]|nr:hypothetical protein [Myxococcales bacterium]
MDRGGADRSSRGLRLASGGGDLIAEIHARQRRRQMRRIARGIVIAIAVVIVAVTVKILTERRARRDALQSARTHAKGGGAADLRLAGDVLDAALIRDDEDPPSLAQRALLRAHLWLEFGEGEQLAHDALAAAPTDLPATSVAAAMLAFADGDLERAATLTGALSTSGDGAIDAEIVWLRGQLVVARFPGDAEALTAALAEIDAAQGGEFATPSLRRVRARLLLELHRDAEAIEELARARELARTHLGLAADEVFFNALLRRESSGVASVADQLLELGDALPPRDRHVTQLARGVVHVYAGEREPGLALLEAGYDGLPRWDR